MTAPIRRNWVKQMVGGKRGDALSQTTLTARVFCNGFTAPQGVRGNFVCQHGARPMTAYSKLQIGVHWAVVGMIAAQWATSGAILRTHNPLLPSSPSDLLLHMVHNYSGMAIGCLVLVRIALRSSRNTVRQQARRTPMELAALAVHWGIYACLAAQAATGFIASYLWGPAASIHKAIWNVSLVLIALHVMAAAWHGVRRDGVVGRMLPFRTRTISGERQRPVH